jgi:ketosteroid isomerase-like protein
VHYDPDALEFFDAGDRVVVFARAVGKGKASGLEVAQDEAHVWTVRDGKLQLCVSYVDRAEALRAAGLSE